MSPEEIVRAELAAWNRRDIDEIMSYFSPDAVWTFPAVTVRGHDSIRAATQGYLARMDHADLEVVNLAVTGNIVMTERVDRFVYEGKRVVTPVMGTFEVAGDKITAWRDYFDSSG
ncbi:MAG: nuclear transport factor 2 family protein [Mycobacteriaceae bacterium]|nr:nuclear transport factor 2 family protein [Mycobacteriaceae bacterium]